MLPLSDDMRRLFGAFVAVALLIANAGVSYAMPVSGLHGQTVESASPHAGARHAENAQVSDCAESAAQQDQGSPAKHGALENCCVAACSPTVAVSAITEADVIDFSVIRLRVHPERSAAWNVPDGLFRPPRTLV